MNIYLPRPLQFQQNLNPPNGIFPLAYQPRWNIAVSPHPNYMALYYQANQCVCAVLYYAVSSILRSSRPVSGEKKYIWASCVA